MRATPIGPTPPPSSDLAASAVVTAEDVRAVAAPLPRTDVLYVRDRLTFRVRSIVYAKLSRDETTLGFGFPKEERAALVSSRPDTFFLPRPSDLRFHWVQAHMDRLGVDEMRDLVVDAWRMVVPKFLRDSVR
jgi:hypothetical protein